MTSKYSRARSNNSINASIKNNTPNINFTINFETIKKIILAFYPDEDEYFFDLIFSPTTNTARLFKGLEKFYKNIKGFSDEDPENKFFGVQNLTKIPNNRKNLESIELNKINTDLIFVLVKEVLLSTYEENIDIDKKSLIKSKLNEIFNCCELNCISFISNKTENYTSLFPVNFYAFCISLKILLLCYPQQIKHFNIGIFMNSDKTLFNKSNNSCFLSELFCCYITFLYLSSNILKSEVATICLHFWEDVNIFDNFTFHISNNGYNTIKKILTRIDKYDILSLLKDTFSDVLYRTSIYLHYNISSEIYNEIVHFLNYGDFPKNINIYCDEKFLNKKNLNVNLFKDITNCKELNIHIISNISLVNINIENVINLKDEENINLTSFSFEGHFIYLENMPAKMSKIKTLKLISSKKPYLIQDESEYKNLHNNKCFNFQKEFFNNFANLEELTLIHITPDQFFTLVSCLNATNNMNQSSIIKIHLEINYSHIKILNNIDNGISKTEILRGVDSLIRNCKRISEIRILEINLINDNPQNNLLLTKENGFYFISLVLELLKRCYQFSLKNFNNYYYPLNDMKPDLKRGGRERDRVREGGNREPRQRIGRFGKKEIGKNIEEFSLEDDVHNCKIYNNLNKDLQVIYNGHEFNDISYIMDLKNSLTFLYVVKKKISKLQPKALVFNIVKFFDIKIIAPKQLSVCNFNN